MYHKNGISVDPLPAGIGTTTTTQNSDGSFTVTNTFTSNAPASGMSQGITISREINSHVIENGRFTKTITVMQNGQQVGEHTIYEDINPTFTMTAPTRVSPLLSEQKQILVNQDYEYESHISSNLPYRDRISNYGKVDLTLNVPKNFKIDESATLSKYQAAGQSTPYTSVTQEAAGSPVIFKGLSLNDDFYIVGRFVMASPTEDESLTAAPSTATWNLNGGKQIQVAVPAWGDTILGNETQLPDGNIFKGNVINAYPTKQGADYQYQDTVPLNSPVDVGTGSFEGEHYINQISISNPSAYSFKNIHYTASFSDGYSVDKISFNNDPSWPVEISGHKLTLSGYIYVTYQDGTSEVVTGDASGNFQINAAKNLAKVEWIDELETGKSMLLEVSGKVAKTLQNGQPVQVGDKLTATINIATDPAHPEFTETSPIGWSKTQTVVQRVTTPWSFSISNDQWQKTAGTKNAGSFEVKIPQDIDHTDLVNPHIYYVLPTTVVGNQANYEDQYYIGNDDIVKFKVKVYRANGRTIVEYDGTGLTIPGYSWLRSYFTHYDLKNNLPNMSSDGYAFISADNLAVKSTSDNPLATSDQLAMLKGAQADHTFLIGKFNVAVQSANGLAIVENAQGNTDINLVSAGHSDDKGSTQMTFSTGVIYNPKEDGTLHNIVVVANLPKTISKTAFNFNLNENGVKAVYTATGETLPAGSYQILYSTKAGNDTTAKTDLSSYVTADQVSDWSQIRSVALKINQLTKDNGAVQLIMQGTDPTVASDAGKISYLTGQLWSDEHKPMTITEGKGSSSIKVDGQSTVKAQLHYKDAQGKDQYIALDDLTHQYKDNQDTMKSTDFTLTDADQKLVPTGYHLAAKTPTIINGSKTWQSDAENGTAAFDQVVKYYFDGDIVQYELTNQATAQLKYYDDTLHQFVSGVTPTDAKGNVDAAITFAPDTLNSLTNKYDYVGISKNDEKSTVDTTAFAKYQFGNYDSDDQTTQTFVIHLKHGTEPVDSQHPYPVDPKDPSKGNVVTSKKVSRTITYKFSDGSTHKAEIPTNPVTETITFTGTGHVDKVTGKFVDIDNQGNITKTYDDPDQGIHWTATGKTTDDGTFDSKKSPTVAGYTPDQSEVGTTTVHHDIKDISKVVTYSPAKQAAQLTFYDDTTGKSISGVQDHANGVTSGTIEFSNGSNLLKKLTDQGYEFVKVVNNTDQQKPVDLSGDQYAKVTFPNFDNNEKVDQLFVVHLKHGKKPVSDDKKVKEVIHYKFEDGTTAADDYTATPIEFKRTGNKDLVTKQITWNPWTPAQNSFVEVTSPTIKGYTPDVQTVAKQDVTADSTDVEKTVTYSADQQLALLTFYDDTTGQVIKGYSDHSNGVTAGKINFAKGSDLVKQLINHGYKFVKVVNDTDAKAPVDLAGSDYASVQYPNFDNDDQMDQSFVVHLVHGTKNVTGTKVVHETIHYRYADGTPVTSDYQATPVEFKRTGIEDLVTQNINWNPWEPADGSFVAVESPKIAGYTTDKVVVDGQSINPDSDDIVVTVTYVAVPKPTTTGKPGNGMAADVNNGVASHSAVGLKNNNRQDHSLPQTGENHSGALVGLGLASMLASLGLIDWKRHHE